jgi:pyruvate/2-oxoglutarate dehydrogenase complex dihydrolipoamide dehydrogenase (E3) component
VPSKALVRAARAAVENRRAADFGLRLDSTVEVDFPAVMARVRSLGERIAARDSVERLAEKNVEVFLGEGRFADRTHIEVNGRRLTFSRAVIATGARPARPDIPGIEQVRCLTSDHLLGLDALPRRLAVIGAGPAGCELAQVFARFGSEVVVYEICRQVLPREDADAALIVQRALERDGVTLRLGCSGVRFEKTPSCTMVHSQVGEHWYADPCDCVMMAAGRVPRIEGLQLEAAGILCDDHGLIVDRFLRTTNPRVFAAGDVCSEYRHTHAADALAHVVLGNALFFASDRASALLVPSCTYTDPEIAHVGVHQSEADATRLKTLRLGFDSLDRAILDGSGDGLLKIHHDHRGTLRGATLVAPHAGETIGEIVVAMNHSVRLGTLASDIHPYPTYAEILKIAGDQFRHGLMTPSMARFLKRLLQWRR